MSAMQQHAAQCHACVTRGQSLQALGSSELLTRALGSEDELADLAAQRPQMARDLTELYVWGQFYELAR